MRPIAGLLFIQTVVIVVDETKCCLSVRLACLFYVCLCRFCGGSRTLTKRPRGRGQTQSEHQVHFPLHAGSKCSKRTVQSQRTRSDLVKLRWKSCCHGDYIVDVYKQCVTRTLAKNSARLSFVSTFNKVLPVKLL